MGYEKTRRPELFPGERNFPLPATISSTQNSTSGGTAIPQSATINDGKTYALTSTSTGAPAYFQMAGPGGIHVGDYTGLYASSIASSSNSPLKIQLPPGFTFDGTNNVAALSTQGASVAIQSMSTSRYVAWGGQGVTLSTST